MFCRYGTLKASVGLKIWWHKSDGVSRETEQAQTSLLSKKSVFNGLFLLRFVAPALSCKTEVLHEVVWVGRWGACCSSASALSCKAELYTMFVWAGLWGMLAFCCACSFVQNRDFARVVSRRGVAGIKFILNMVLCIEIFLKRCYYICIEK